MILKFYPPKAKRVSGDMKNQYCKFFKKIASVTSNSSLSFEARMLKFCLQTAWTLAIKYINQIFEILSWAEMWGFFKVRLGKVLLVHKMAVMGESVQFGGAGNGKFLPQSHSFISTQRQKKIHISTPD